MPPATPMIGTNTLHPNSEQNNFPEPKYSEAKQRYLTARRMRMIAARDTRDAVRDEYDGMGFLKYIDILKKHDDQYIAPRKNKTDTSINLGTIRDKDTTLVEYASKFDFEPVAQCFDDDDEILNDMAETAEDLVRKSLLLENDREKQKLVARSMVSFGTAYYEDAWVEIWKHEKTLNKNFSVGANNAQWVDKLVKVYEGCQGKLWDIRKIYNGDVTKFFLNGPQGQPFFFTVEYQSYDVTKSIFGGGDWDMWQYVPTYVIPTPEISQPLAYTSAWTLRPITMNSCEIVRYYDPIMNEFAITINGIDMLPIMESPNPKWKEGSSANQTLISGFPLTAISPSGAIPFAKYDLEPMHDFYLSKSQPGKMRVLADVENMLMKLNLGMIKQKAKPTMGNKSGRNFGPEITEPNEIINDVRDGDLFPILPNYVGMMPADFSFFELVKKELDKNSVQRSFQGTDPNQQDKTATQEMDEMKASALKVSALIDGLISGRTQLFWLRNFSISKNWTKPIDSRVDIVNKTIVDKYRTVNVPTEAEGGQKAVKKIIFTKDTTATSQQLHQKEVHIQKGYKKSKIHPSVDHIDHTGEDVRIALLHPEMYATMKLSWFWTCIPIPNGTDPLAYMMFAKQITDAIAFFGPQSMNVKKLKHKFASITGNDFDTWFISEMELQQAQQQAQQEEQVKNASSTANGASTKSQLAENGAPSMKSAMVGNMTPQVM